MDCDYRGWYYPLMEKVKTITGPFFATRDGRIFGVRGYELIGSRRPDGRYTVGYRVNGVVRSVFKHRLVLEAFHGPKPTNDHTSQCRHLDGNHMNNHADNLRWGTDADNKADAVRLGEQRQGSLTREQVSEIRSAPKGSIAEQARRFGKSLKAIRNVRYGHTYRYF